MSKRMVERNHKKIAEGVPVKYAEEIVEGITTKIVREMFNFFEQNLKWVTEGFKDIFTGI